MGLEPEMNLIGQFFDVFRFGLVAGSECVDLDDEVVDPRHLAHRPALGLVGQVVGSLKAVSGFY
jgi:hypothetical protein